MKGLRFDCVIHDEISYTWKDEPMSKDPVYAIDEEGVIHLWWPYSKYSHSSCGLLREQVVSFQVENLATCMTCLAQKEEEEKADTALTQLERQLVASLRVPSSWHQRD